jgi:hypothetical protein
MRGYAGRESPPPSNDRLTVGDGQISLMRAIEQVKIANKLGEHFKTKFLRVAPGRYGVNFVTYDPDGRVKSLVEIGELPFTALKDNTLPVVYPADPFLNIPTLLLVRHPVTLVVRFKDCVAWSIVSAPEAGKSAGLLYRVGHVQSDEHSEVPALVLEIPADTFKIVGE